MALTQAVFRFPHCDCSSSSSSSSSCGCGKHKKHHHHRHEHRRHGHKEHHRRPEPVQVTLDLATLIAPDGAAVAVDPAFLTYTGCKVTIPSITVINSGATFSGFTLAVTLPSSLAKVVGSATVSVSSTLKALFNFLPGGGIVITLLDATTGLPVAFPSGTTTIPTATVSLCRKRKHEH